MSGESPGVVGNRWREERETSQASPASLYLSPRFLSPKSSASSHLVRTTSYELPPPLPRFSLAGSREFLFELRSDGVLLDPLPQSLRLSRTLFAFRPGQPPLPPPRRSPISLGLEARARVLLCIATRSFESPGELMCTQLAPLISGSVLLLRNRCGLRRYRVHDHPMCIRRPNLIVSFESSWSWTNHR